MTNQTIAAYHAHQEESRRKWEAHDLKVIERRDRLLSARAMPHDSDIADVVDAASKVMRSLRLVKWEHKHLLKYYSLSGHSDPGFGTKYADLLGIAQCRMKWAMEANDRGGVNEWIDRVLAVLPQN